MKIAILLKTYLKPSCMFVGYKNNIFSGNIIKSARKPSYTESFLLQIK